MSYFGKSVLQNVQLLDLAAFQYSLTHPVRVFTSKRTAAVLLTLVPLESVKEPHVAELRGTFTETPLDVAKARFRAHPTWPYAGRTQEQAWSDLADKF